MTFAEHVARERGSWIKARRSYMAERRWTAEDWYIAWAAGDLAREVVAAAEQPLMRIEHVAITPNGFALGGFRKL